MNTQEFVDQLRKVADLYEENSKLPQENQLPIPSNVNLGIWCWTKEDFQKIARAFGELEKSYTESYAIIQPKGISILSANINRTEVCTKRVVGEETVPERYVPGYTVPAEKREVVEWDCHSLLSLDEVAEVIHEEVAAFNAEMVTPQQTDGEEF